MMNNLKQSRGIENYSDKITIIIQVKYILHATRLEIVQEENTWDKGFA